MTTPIRVIILDDHPLVRAGIRAVLEPAADIAIVGEGSAGEHLEPLIRAQQPDVVLLDVQMPQQEGDNVWEGELFQATRVLDRLLPAYPRTRYLVISQYRDRQLVERLVSAGASGYLLKDDALSLNLVQAVKVVHSGGFCVSASISALLLEPAAGSPSPDLLTERQKAILRQSILHPDWSYDALARSLGISTSTFKNHLSQIRDRLGVQNQVAAVLMGVQMGLVSPEHIRLPWAGSGEDR